jgi:hypothetical protein
MIRACYTGQQPSYSIRSPLRLFLMFDKLETPDDLFERQLKDLYSTESQLMKNCLNQKAV